METKTGIMKISELTRGNILVTIIIVGALTAGNIWLHRSEPSLGYDRYDNYGFALDYSVRMTLTEFGLGGPEPNESGGFVQVSLQGNGVEQYGILWTALDRVPTLMRSPEGAMYYIFAIMEMDGTVLSDRGPIISIIHNGHDMIYQTFNIVEQGFDIPGIMSAMYCEATGTYFWFYFVYLPDPENPTVDPQELEQGWFGYLDGFRCHV